MPGHMVYRSYHIQKHCHQFFLRTVLISDCYYHRIQGLFFIVTSIQTPALPPDKEQVDESRTTGRLLPYLFVVLSAIAALIVGIILPLQAIYQAMPATPLGAWLLSLTRLLFPGEPHTLVQQVPVPAPHMPLLTMWGETGLLLAAIAVLFACYLLAIRFLAGRVSHRFILLSTLVLGLVYLLIPTYTSQDIFSYIVYARLGAVYHLNPLTALPTAIPHDLIYPYIFWIHQPSAYGPLWAAITCLLQWASPLVALLPRFNDLSAMILLLRLWGLAMHLGSALLIWSISGRWQRHNGAVTERARLAALLAFAWNPLLLFEACVNAHIDTTILFFILLALWALVPRKQGQRQPYLLAVFVLALATCLKVTAVLLLPGLLLFLWAQRGRRWQARPLRPIIFAVLLYTATIVLLYAPFWQHGAIIDVFSINPGLTRDINSPYEFFLRLYEGIRGQRPIFVTSDVGSAQEILTHKISDALFVIVYGALCVWSFFKPGRIATLPALVRWLALAWLLYCLVGSPWFWPWYMTTFFGLAALSMALSEDGASMLGGREKSAHFDLRAAFFLLSFSLLSLYCFSTWGPGLTGLPPLAYFAVSQLRGLWAWGFLVLAVRLRGGRFMNQPSSSLLQEQAHHI